MHIVRHLPIAREPRKAPIVLSPEEVARMLEAAPGLQYKAALSVAYGAGLRVSEVVAPQVSDIDSARMMIRIEQSKRRKDRYAMLSPRLLDLLRDWWLVCRSRGWLFPGRDPLQPITTRVSLPAPAMRPRRRPGSTSLRLRTRCGTALPRIYWSRTSMFA